MAVAELPPPYTALAPGGLVYDATFRYKEFQASGLLVMKRLQKGEYHVVLVSKVGPSLMEFKLNREGVHWIKTFDQLKKKSAEKLLERDFKVMLLSTLDDPGKVRRKGSKGSMIKYKVSGDPALGIIIDSQSQRVMYAENRSFVNPLKTKVQFSYGEEEIPSRILLTHTNMRMSMDLTLLQ